MKENKKYQLSGKEWEKLASFFSDETKTNSSQESNTNDEVAEMGKLWKEVGNMNRDKEYDVDKAWNNVYSRILEAGEPVTNMKSFRRIRINFVKIAAILILLLGSGALFFLMKNQGSLIYKNSFITLVNDRTRRIDLPDGSTVFLNRNSSLSYKQSYGTKNRNVKLKGEAFFEIVPDASNPFIIDAGKANIKVVGTSFNVITENSDSEVEVYVKTGKVMLEDKTGSKSLLLDPGYIGKISALNSEKTVNENNNYLAWNTGKLVYEGEKLEVVFKDLKRVYNIDIIAEDTSIYDLPWTAPIDYQPEETIIKMICLSFDLIYTKDGQEYHLSRN